MNKHGLHIVSRSGDGQGTGTPAGSDRHALRGRPNAADGDGQPQGGGATEALLELARAGDVEAFARLFEEHRPLLYRVACRLVGENDGEDVVMDTYLKVWRAIPRFQGSGIRTWLCKVTRNCALDHLRARRRQEARFQSEDSDPDGLPLLDRLADPRGESPERRALLDDLGSALRAALQALSPEHRQTLVLREVDGLSYREVAAATGVTIGTVMSRLFYAKRRVRKNLQREELSP